MAANPRREAQSVSGGLLGAANLPVILLIAAMVVGLAALLPLVQSSGATTVAGNIEALEQERSDWQARLHEQEVHVAQMGSLDRIEQEARNRLHMGPPAETHYITVDAPAPAPRRIPSRFLPPVQEHQAAGSSLWEDVLGWLPVP